VLQAVVLVGAGYYLLGLIRPHWPAIRERQFAWQAGPLLLSAVLVLLTLAIFIGAWVAALRWCAVRVHARDAAKIWFTANLARFLPGGVWQFASLAVMASRYGVSTAAATATVLLEQIVLLLTGLAVVAAFTPIVLHATWWRVAVVVALALGAVTLLLLPRLTRRLPSLGLLWSRLGPAQLALFAVILTVPWFLYGAAFRLLAVGLLAPVNGSWGFYVAAFTGSYLAGVIAVFAPAGLFVREAALISVLTPVLGGGDAVILALASRAWLTALEILSGVVVLALPRAVDA
jgi:uncharacterized membrane protein YbhN (UPF0104 family)